MKRKLYSRVLFSVLLCAALLYSALSFAVPAMAEADTTYTVSVTTTGSFPSARTVTIKVTRSKTGAAETIHISSYDVTAVAGVHYVLNGTALSFGAGDTMKSVTVTEKAIANVALENRYSTGGEFIYGLCLTDEGGLPVTVSGGENLVRSIPYGNSYRFSGSVLSSSVTDLLYIKSGNFATGMASGKYVDIPLTSDTETRVTDGGYSQGIRTASLAGLYGAAGVPGKYLDLMGVKVYAVAGFTMREQYDGYQYIQILADNDQSFDGNDPDGAVYDPVLSQYKACFELSASGSSVVTTDSVQFFPHLLDAQTADGNAMSTWTEFPTTGAKLYQQKFNTEYPRSPLTSGLVLRPTVGALSIRFDAAGKDDDDWYFKNLFVRAALEDSTAPTLTSVTVDGGPHPQGGNVYVSLHFSEVVNAVDTTLDTSWGILSCVPGDSKSSTVTYTGFIGQAAGTQLIINSLSGAVADLAGNAFTGTISQGMNATVDDEYSYPITYYDLADGTLAQSNPGSYTYSDSFTLNNPTREGYSFDGWTGTGLSQATRNVTVPSGSHGSRTYRATWKIIDYAISTRIDGAGTVTVSQKAHFGDSVTFSVEPDSGWLLYSVTLDGVPLEPDAGGEYGFTMPSHGVNVAVAFVTYTVSYDWPRQTNIWLDADDQVPWSADGVTLDPSRITVTKNGAAFTDYIVEGNGVVMEPGENRIHIAGDNGMLDDWVVFTVVKLVENDPNLTVDVPAVYINPSGVTESAATVYYGSLDVTGNAETELWYRHNAGNPDSAHDDSALYADAAYSTREGTHIGSLDTAVTYTAPQDFPMHVFNITGSASLDGVTRFDTVCGKLIWHREGEQIRRKADLDGVPASSGVTGGYIYYVGDDCPDLCLREGKVYLGDVCIEGEGEAGGANENKAITDDKNIFYAGGQSFVQSDNIVYYGSLPVRFSGVPQVLTCETVKALGRECHCAKDANGNCISCFSQNGDTLTVCGETIRLGPYIVVGENFVFLGDKSLYKFVPSSPGSTNMGGGSINWTFNENTQILTVEGYPIYVGSRPVLWLSELRDTAQVYYPTMNDDVFNPCAYVKYQTGDYCYAVARRDYEQRLYASDIAIECAKVINVGEAFSATITSQGSAGAITFFLNNEKVNTTIDSAAGPSYELTISFLAEGTYVLRAVLEGDEAHYGAETAATFEVVKKEPHRPWTVTGTGLAGEELVNGAVTMYDPEGFIVVSIDYPETVTGVSWKWQISGSSDPDVVEIDHVWDNKPNNCKPEAFCYLRPVGTGRVTLWVRFSGNDHYAPSQKAITFIVGPVPTLRLPSEIKTIEESAFEGLAMTIVEIPDGCESIGNYAFKDCPNLTRILIPDSVTTIGTDIFNGCTQTVYVFGTADSEAARYCLSHDNCEFVAE